MANQWGSELSGNEQAAIDIAVRVEGRGAVTDLQGALHALKTDIEFQKAAYHGAAQNVTEFTKAMAPLLAQQAKLEEAIKRANNQLKGLGGAFHVSSQAGLQLGYALDDIQYGFSAIVNNVPGIVQSLGGNAGLAGGLGVAFVAANLLSKGLPAISEQLEAMGSGLKQAVRDLDFIRDPLKDATGSIAGMTEVIAALNAKPIKLEVDHDAIRGLTREMRDATRAVKEFDALTGRDSKATREAKDTINRGIVEGGGADAIEDALIEIKKRDGTYAAGSELHGQIAVARKGMGTAAKAINLAGGPGSVGAAPFVGLFAFHAKQIADLEHQMDQEARENIKQSIEMRGGEGGRQAIESMLLDPKNQDILRRKGVTNEAKLGVVMASPWNMAAQGKDAAEAELQRDNAREAKRRDEKRQQAERQSEIEQQGSAREEAAEAEAIMREDDAMRRLTQQIRAKNEREAAAKANKDKAGQLRNEREAPGIAKHARESGYAQTIQANSGVGDAAANEAGRLANQMVEKGADPWVAMTAALQKVVELNRQQQANAERALGIIGPATMEIQMLQQQARALGGNQRRMGNQRPTRAIPFN